MDLPRRIGPYRVLSRLGYGGMAEVFLAIAFGASGFEKRVAIKWVRPELRGAGECERLLIEEARLGAMLSHRNLVAIDDLGVDDGVYYVRMEYVDGSDLATLTSAARPTPALALALVAELALALGYVHGARDADGRPLGLVHRDVGPRNVLVSRAGEVKLADFGVAKATMLAEVTRGGVRKGTYAYMSPEQVVGATLSAASDQFALGITLAELLTGVRPFDGATPLETMEQIRLAVPPVFEGVAPALAAILSRCLARDPAARFESAEALWRALAHVRQGLEPVGPPEIAAWVARSAPA